MAYASLDSKVICPFLFGEFMVQRGRPAKVLSNSDLDELYLFLQTLPFRKKNQDRVLELLQSPLPTFDESHWKILKLADRERLHHLQRQILLEQIKLKQVNLEKLQPNELEILDLIADMDDRVMCFFV